MNDAPDPIAVVARLRAKPGERAEMLAALRGLVDAADDEPGTLMYVFHEDLEDPDVVWAYECYRDRAALDAHSTSTAMHEIIGTLAPHVADAPQLHELRPVVGKAIPR